MKFLNLNEVVQMTGLSAATLRRLEKSSAFPKRRKLSHRRVGWLEAEVLNWIKRGTK